MFSDESENYLTSSQRHPKFSKTTLHMFIKCIYEIIGLREHPMVIAGVEFHFNSPIAAVVHLSAKCHAGGGASPPPAT
jgi:hypothetical protein